MTRWTFVLILWDKVLLSAEFNWDMYPEWFWDEALMLLEGVNTEQEFRDRIKKFNEDHFWYEEDLVLEIPVSDFEDALDMSEDYFKYWFSDWLFFKNLSKASYVFKLDDEDKRSVILEQWETMRLNFWHIWEEDEWMFYIVNED